MRIVLIVTMTLVAGAMARNSHSEYGVPFPSAKPRPAPPPETTESFRTSPQKVHRHVYVHVAPEEESVSEDSKVIRIPGKKEKHVNIIFVKTPSASSDQKTEVVLPAQEQHRNLIYVLLKGGESDSNIKIRQPQSKALIKPKVYFIRYKSETGHSSTEVPRPRPIPTPNVLYGAPTTMSLQNYPQPRN